MSPELEAIQRHAPWLQPRMLMPGTGLPAILEGAGETSRLVAKHLGDLGAIAHPTIVPTFAR